VNNGRPSNGATLPLSDQDVENIGKKIVVALVDSPGRGLHLVGTLRAYSFFKLFKPRSSLTREMFSIKKIWFIDIDG